MGKKSLLVAMTFPITVLLVAVLSGCARDAAPVQGLLLEPESPIVEDCSDADADADAACYSLLDCSAGNACVTRRVTFDAAACGEKEKQAWCDNFAKRLPTVKLVSDAYNFISAPFTLESVNAELVTSTLNANFDLEFLPDDTMLVTQLDGKLLHIDLAGNSKTVLDIDVYKMIETGLLGLAVDPLFAENGYIYLYYTYGTDDSDPAFLNPEDIKSRRILNRVSRWALKDGVVGDETILLDAIPGTVMHAGGRLEIDTAGKLYVTTGDGAIRGRPESAVITQDTAFLGGKVLRLNRDGSVPADNPLPGSFVYSRGHRNPSGIAWHPETGALYTSEHGPHRFDEINRIEPGANYGWGSYKCREPMVGEEPKGDFSFPVVCMNNNWTLAPGGMDFVSERGHRWYGSLFVGSLRGKHLHRYAFNGDELAIDEIFYIVDRDKLKTAPGGKKMDQRLRDIEFHKGALYLLGDKFGIVKLTPAV